MAKGVYVSYQFTFFTTQIKQIYIFFNIQASIVYYRVDFDHQFKKSVNHIKPFRKSQKLVFSILENLFQSDLTLIDGVEEFQNGGANFPNKVKSDQLPLNFDDLQLLWLIRYWAPNVELTNSGSEVGPADPRALVFIRYALLLE